MPRSVTLFFAFAIAAWVAGGIVFLLPKKMRIMKRVGRVLTPVELIELARRGDREARELRRAAGWYALAGTAIVLAAMLARSVLGG